MANRSRSARRREHIAGFCLLNDWSARDIQSWESQPLGPFLAKSFRTSCHPGSLRPRRWQPFRIAQPARPDGDPQPLPHLLDDAADQANGALDIECEVLLSTPTMRPQAARRIGCAAPIRCDLYWTVAQMVAHHTSGGCNLQPGDLFGSGTISGTDPDGYRLPAGNDLRRPRCRSHCRTAKPAATWRTATR